MARILVVDDSALSRRVSRRILEGAGHAVADVADGLTALERYALDRPDLVLLDVTMAEMDGLEVLRQIKVMDSTAVVVMATADVQSSTRTLAETGGASGFVSKPLSAETVLQAVDAALVGQGGAK
ncbi:response regulator receiver protein : Response regulator receiver protein OS=Crinalium epipsammum PCC 9333 GN=Cri9333_3528 PE=4 SV=1: Response_reg [Gemmata massiliana]|uniref:Response regulatory domain-containing protein n=1 Tax=Gemmata massiliana TaxID=1210884 RepID=A0A6P2CYS7_9BACT|nr:response regulator [Gemmata massiliana]VTR94049.1 response regulator receiver protein : Response regulator receiver protein OS=Crinalium epipsammum PCC 9333 GN=Cri9333_3528 PE=4 SV=1: Response_reg [Gemmata massiliana]